ncbi:MAG: helix-turn-helix domain-containing protein [Acidimicrobiales bacterium]
MADIQKIPQLITIEQLADRLGVPQRFIRRLIAEGRLPYRKLGKLIRFSENEIAAWLDTTRRPRSDDDRTA